MAATTPQIRRNDNNKPQAVSENPKWGKEPPVERHWGRAAAMAGSAPGTESTTRRKAEAEKRFCTLPKSRLLCELVFFRKLWGLSPTCRYRRRAVGMVQRRSPPSHRRPASPLAPSCPSSPVVPIFPRRGLPESKTVWYYLQPPTSDLARTPCRETLLDIPEYTGSIGNNLILQSTPTLSLNRFFRLNTFRVLV